MTAMANWVSRAFVVVLLVLLIALQINLWFGKGGIRDLRVLEEKVAEQNQQIEKLKEENALLQAEVDDLKTGLDAIEERAREELGLIKQGETFYQIVRPNGEVNE